MSGKHRVPFPEFVTNNEAEYNAIHIAMAALISALREAERDTKRVRLEVYGDSPSRQDDQPSHRRLLPLEGLPSPEPSTLPRLHQGEAEGVQRGSATTGMIGGIPCASSGTDRGLNGLCIARTGSRQPDDRPRNETFLVEQLRGKRKPIRDRHVNLEP